MPLQKILTCILIGIAIGLLIALIILHIYTYADAKNKKTDASPSTTQGTSKK